MSLDHDDDMVTRLSSSRIDDSNLNLTKQEKELQKLQEEKQKLMINQNQQYLNQLFEENSTQPIRIKNIQLTNGQSFRDDFIQAQFQPLLENSLPITLSEFVSKIDEISRSFTKLGVVEQIMVSINQLPKYRGRFASKSPCLDIVPIFNILPVKRFYAKTGTNIGNGEGDGYIQFQLKNIFGGGENLILDAITGTKTQSSYLLNYIQPIFNSSNYISENLVYMNTRKFDWIGSEVITKGITNKIYTQHDNTKLSHEFILENVWKVLNNLNSKSNDILAQSGHNFKSSLIYNCTYDTRDNKHLPLLGKYLRWGLEYNGLFKFNHSPFIKSVFESQFVIPINKILSSLILTNKCGFLYPLSKTSFVLDRFFIGGANDVRSFTMNGLGPKQYNSSTGGDVFLNGGISLVSKIPKVDPDSNFKIHNFLNFGKLLPLDKTKMGSLADQFTKQYSVSFGSGILYNHPMARFELNICLPLMVNERDGVRKGLQYGIGMSFL
jgi:Outer membrane protein/protective antigen OMA87